MKDMKKIKDPVRDIHKYSLIIIGSVCSDGCRRQHIGSDIFGSLFDDRIRTDSRRMSGKTAGRTISRAKRRARGRGGTSRRPRSPPVRAKSGRQEKRWKAILSPLSPPPPPPPPPVYSERENTSSIGEEKCSAAWRACSVPTRTTTAGPGRESWSGRPWPRVKAFRLPRASPMRSSEPHRQLQRRGSSF